MELLIRSQDKRILTKYDLLSTEKCGALIEHRIFAYMRNSKIYLGIYKNEERALEVLDEIQNITLQKAMLQAKTLLSANDMAIIQKKYNMKVLPSSVDVINPLSTSIVYEMPKE